jgi:uncharacterized membrane protein
MEIVGILFVVLGITAVPALVLFLIERSRRHALQDRVGTLEHRVSDMSRSLADLLQRERDPARRPPEDEVTQPLPVPPDLEATLPTAPAPPSPPPAPAPAAPVPAPPADPMPAAAFTRPAAPPAPAKPASAGFEQRLATQWTTWLGAVALLLAGIFLVKLSIEWGILGPKARVAGAYLGGVVLLVLGERLRARSYAAAQGASAAGVAVLYAATMAAANLYHFVGPFAAMALLLLTTGAAVLLAWRSGPAVAVVGLLGGFLLPVFLSSDRPRVWALLGYLLLVHGGLVAVAALRKWPALVTVSALGTLLWGGIYAWKYFALAPWALGGLVLGAVAALLLARRTVKGGADYDLIPAGSLTAFFLILCTVARPYSMEAWAMLAVLSAGIIVLSTRRPYEVAAFAAAVILLVTESVQLLGPRRPDHALAILLGFGALWALGSWLAHWRSSQPVANLLAGAVAAAGALGLAYLMNREAPLPVRPSVLALSAGALLVAMALPILRKRALPSANERLAVLLGAATLLLSAALPMELEDAWLTVAWAVEALLLVFLDSRLRVPALRVFAYGLAAGTGVRLLLNPWIFSYPTKAVPVFNWLLYAYGIATAAFALAGRLLRNEGHGAPARFVEWLARATGTALVLLEIRHWLHNGTLKGTMDDPWEWAAYILAMFALAFLFKALHTRALTFDNLTAARILGAAALFFEGWVLVLILNPLWHAVWVGTTPVANGLLILYGFPLLGCLACARWINREVQPLRWLHLVGAYALGALLLTFLVRHAYHPETMHLGKASDLEQYTYSAAWILLAVGTLVAGILRKSKALRFTSLGVMMAAVAKVFLYDITALSDLHRFLSFVALGASLIGIGVIYQKFVFKER